MSYLYKKPVLPWTAHQLLPIPILFFILSSASFPACLSFADPVGSADPVPSFSNVLSLYRLYSTCPPSLAPFGAKLSYKLVIQYIVRSFSLLLGKPGILICKPL